MTRDIDSNFDVSSDAGGKDPDSSSPTLKRYHQLLWSKPLPRGANFTLDTTTPGVYLHHKSDLGEFELSSDSIVHPYDYWTRTEELIKQIPKEDLDDFNRIGNTIGGYIIFPSNPVEGRQTINLARGGNAKINDRFDLTLECIRRHYKGEVNPLSDTLSRYAPFFALFEDFDGYVDFFLLQDLVSVDGNIKFYLPFDDFSTPSLPETVDEYQRYRAEVTRFVTARNARIDATAS